MNLQSFTKIEIAVKQIETAIDIYMRGQDFFSLITLAGAGEEILGRLIENSGGRHSLNKQAEALIEIHKVINQKEVDLKTARNTINKSKNSIKHMGSSQDETIIMDPTFEAEAMLYRAIENYYALTGRLTEKMLSYNNSIIRKNHFTFGQRFS